MSLERNIQELHQAVTMLTKSIDLQTATIAEATAELLQAMHSQQAGAPVKVVTEAKAAADNAKAATANAKAATANAKAAAAAVEKAVKKEEAPAELTDDEIKASAVYQTIQDKLTQHYGAALAANGGDQQAAREDTLKILKAYADDGKVVSLVRVLLEDEEAGAQVMEELLGVYDTAITALQTTSDVDEEGEGEEDEGEEQAYTADDVKAALRAYAKIEGRPAAIMKLQQLTNGKSEVKDVPEDQYAAVIAGLKADM